MMMMIIIIIIIEGVKIFFVLHWRKELFFGRVRYKNIHDNKFYFEGVVYNKKRNKLLKQDLLSLTGKYDVRGNKHIQCFFLIKKNLYKR